MTIKTTTQKPIPAAPVKGDIFLDGRCVHFGDEYQGADKISASAIQTVTPPLAHDANWRAIVRTKARATREKQERLDESNALRAELLEIDLNHEASLPETAPHVTEAMSEQSRQIESERKAYLTFDELRADIAGLSWRLTMTSWIVAVAIIIAILMKLA